MATVPVPALLTHPPIVRVGLVHDDPRRPGGFWLEGWEFDTSRLTGTSPWEVGELREISDRLGAGYVFPR